MLFLLISNNNYIMLFITDIKGANILVDPNGEIKLADFGMAKHVSPLHTKLTKKKKSGRAVTSFVMSYNNWTHLFISCCQITNCTSMLSFKGSPYWMAPEVNHHFP